MDIKILEYIENVAIIELPVEGFNELSLKEKLIAYHLCMAAIKGQSITYDQKYVHGLRLRDFFSGLSMYIKDKKLTAYTSKIFLNHGIHDAWSTIKFTPSFTKSELKGWIKDAEKNGFMQSMNPELEKTIFDPGYDMMLTCKNPTKGDIITESRNNYYNGLTLKDLENYVDKNPNNSTTEKVNGKIIENIWRAGNEKITKGKYSAQLTNIIYHLKEASKYSSDEQKESFRLMIKYFEEGIANYFDDYNIQWLKTDPEVDTILGFIEEYLDVRGKKGLFEGMAYIKNHKANATIKYLASIAQKLESDSPWEEKYKKKWDKVPIANAITMMIGTGGAGPLSFVGVNLPNAQEIREKYGSKNIIISNTAYISRNVLAKQVYDEFIENKTDRQLMMKYLQERTMMMIALHEVVGHGSGKSSEKLKGDPREYLREYYSTMEEARAELCALHHVWNPLLKTGEEFAKSAYIEYIYTDLLRHRRFTDADEIHEDHDRAIHMIVQYIIDKGSAEFYKYNGKTYPRVKDYTLMRRHIAELLKEVQRIKSEGDYEAIKTLVIKYGIHFDKRLRDEIIERTKKIKYPKYCGYVMAIPELVKKGENVVDVKLTYPKSAIDQGNKWMRIEKDL